MSDQSERDVHDVINDMARLLQEIDELNLHPASIMSEAEGRLLDEFARQPRFATNSGAPLLSVEVDTQYLRWWHRGTDVGLALARVADERIAEAAGRADRLRESVLDGLDQYAEDIANLALEADSAGE